MFPGKANLRQETLSPRDLSLCPPTPVIFGRPGVSRTVGFTCRDCRYSSLVPPSPPHTRPQGKRSLCHYKTLWERDHKPLPNRGYRSPCPRGLWQIPVARLGPHVSRPPPRKPVVVDFRTKPHTGPWCRSGRPVSYDLVFFRRPDGIHVWRGAQRPQR